MKETAEKDLQNI